jgi:hypothetical protein
MSAGLMGLWAVGLGALGSTGVLGGCQRVLPPRNLKAPELRLTEFRLDRLQRGQARIGLTLDARNPNDIDLPLSDVRFAIQLFGVPVGEGRIDEPSVLLPALGTRSLPLVILVAPPELARALRRGLAERLSGTMAESSPEPGAQAPATTPDWQVRGQLRWGLNPLPLEFNQSGRLGGRESSASP